MVEKKKYIKQTPQILWLLYFFVSLFKYMTYIPEFVGNILIIGMGTFSVIFCFLKKGMNRQLPYIFFVFQYTVWGVLGLIYNGNMDIQELLWPLGFMGIGLLALNFQLSTRITRFMLYGYGTFIVLKIIEYGNEFYSRLSGSRNGISVDTLTYLAVHMIAAYQSQEDVKIWTAIFVMIVCLFGIGRSGIIISFLLVCFFTMFKFRRGRSSVRNVLMLPIISIMAICAVIIFYQFLSKYIDVAINNFQRRGLESTRLIIWTDYLKKIFSCSENVLFGAKVSGTMFLDLYKTNLHNSFLMLHAKYGIWGIAMMFIMLVKTISTLLKEKNYYLFIPFLTVFIRMNFDYTNFNSPMDTVFIFFLLYPYYRKGAVMNVAKQERKCIESCDMVYNKQSYI